MGPQGKQKGRREGPFLVENAPHSRNLLNQLKIGDFIVIGVIMLFIGASSGFLPVGRKGGTFVTVIQDNRTAVRYPLAGEKSIDLECKTGLYRIQIRDRSVWVEEAHCPRQICVKAKRITSSGQMIVCIPNHILIRIEGQSKGTLDAVTQ